MHALVTVDHHFIRTPDGKVWVQNIHDHLFWQRYLGVFDTITVVCRMREGLLKDVEGYVQSDCEGVYFIGLPDFRGPRELIKVYTKIKRIIRKEISAGKFQCAVCRLPSTIGFLAYSRAKNIGIRTAVEVVADPWDAYSDRFNPVLFFIKSVLVLQLKSACHTADGVSYVTEFALQKRYPPKNYHTHYSSIDLEDWFFVKPEEHDWLAGEKTLVHVSNINNDAKGHDILLKAIKRVVNRGYLVKCMIVGDGRARQEYMKMAADMGLSDAVVFTGLISGKDNLRSLLAKAHLFVFPTKAEGLPRVLIEAMACSLPCLSTPVNGIPELLKPQYLLDQQDDKGYADKIMELLDKPQLLIAAANENYNKATEYRIAALSTRRTALYQYIKSLAANGKVKE